MQAKQTPYEFYLQDMLAQVGDPFPASLRDDQANFSSKASLKLRAY